MDIAKEIVTLIKFSPKRESLLQQLKENLETEDEDTSSLGIIGLWLEPIVFDEFLRTIQFLWKSGMFACPNDCNPMYVQG